MIYLAGNTSLCYLRQLGLGVMLTPGKGGRTKMTQVPWAADNGCFARGAAFHLARWYRWLAWMAPGQATCLFATAPDVLGDAAATWQRSREPLAELRQLGWRAALVAQDGIEDQPIAWDAFDCLFLGGTTAWKLSSACAVVAQEAKRRGKFLHMGRVNSYQRLVWAQSLGCDACDGTFLSKAPDHNAPRMARWMKRLARQPVLPLSWGSETAA